MKINAYIQKQVIENGKTISPPKIRILKYKPQRGVKPQVLEFGKWYDKSGFSLYEAGNINVEIKGDKIKLTDFAVYIKYPEQCPGYTGKVVKHYVVGDDYYTANM